MKGMLLSIVLLLFAGSLSAQSGRQSREAKQLFREAEELMQRSDFAEASRLLYRAKGLDRDNYRISYRLGESLYLLEDYEKAARAFAPLLRERKADARLYQLYGNSLDLSDKSAAARKTYQKGLALFPESGILWMEMGLLEYSEGFYDDALNNWEKGIEAQASLSGNYYWAAKSHFQRKNYALALIYGESFVNLERGSERTEEISGLLADCYRSAWQGMQDNYYQMDWLPEEPFEPASWTVLGRFQNCMDSIPATATGAGPDIAKILEIRKVFLQRWRRQKFRGVPLFNWWEKLDKQGHFEAYSYWVLGDGFTEEAVSFYEERPDLYEPFEAWFLQNTFSQFLP